MEEVFWLKNGQILSEGDERGYKVNDNDNLHVLTIPSFDSETDDGNYTCNVVQFSQIYMKEIMVTAYSSPAITVFEIPEGNFGLEGQNAVFKCQATGKPTPSYTWNKHTDDGHALEITSGDKYNLEDGLLKINYLTESDGGDYSCTATNVMGNATRGVKLSIHKKPRINRMDDIVTELGNDVELICKIDSDSDVTDAYFMFNKQKYAPQAIPTPEPEPESEEINDMISESPETANENEEEDDANNDGSEVDDEEDGTDDEDNNNDDGESKRKRRAIPEESIIVEWRDADLVLKIKNVQMEHMGKYACHAQNMAGYGHDNTKVLVKHSPVFNNISDRYIRRQLGESASIYCQVSAVPNANLKIDHDGSKVYADGTSLIIDQTDDKIHVIFNNLKESDFGEYQCTAKNSEGTAEPAEFTLIKIEEPKLPESIVCTEEIYPNYAICKMAGYTDNRGEWPTEFEVYYVESAEELEDGFDWETEATIVNVDYYGHGELRIPGLRPSSHYYTRFRAVNEAGRSELSNMVDFETTSPWTPEPVTDVTIDCPDVCSVNWTAPNDRGSPITGYRLVFKEVSKVESDDENVEIDRTVSIESAENENDEVEDGDNHDDDGNEGENSNENVEVSIAGDEVNVSNENSNEADDNSDEEDDKEDDEIVIDVGSSNTHVDLPQLLPLRNYQLLIYARNEEGESQQAEYYFRTTENSGLATLFPLPNWFVICIVITFIVLIACTIDAVCCKTRQCGILACITSHRRNRMPKDIEQGNPSTENRGLLSEKHQNE